MTTPKTIDKPAPDFKRSVAAALADERIGIIFDRCTRHKDEGRRAIMPELGDPLGVRTLAARIKDHTLQNLDKYLEQLVTRVEKLGGHVHFAETGQDACEIITGLARDADEPYRHEVAASRVRG